MPDASPQPNLSLPAPRLSLRFWAVVAATGAGAGLAGGLFMRLLYAVQDLGWSQGSGTGDFLDDVRRTSAMHRLAVLGIAGVIAGLGRWMLVLRRAQGKGHGGDLSQAIWQGLGRIPFLQTLARGVLSIVVVGLGASLGREGAVKQAGASWGSKLADWTGLTLGQRRLVLACGAGAGIAAAYNVPFGGAMFACEVLLGTLALPQVVPALLASLIATAASWLLLPNVPAYAVEATRSPFALIVWAAVAGPILGFAAAGYIRVIEWTDRKHFQGAWVPIAPFLALVLLGAASIEFPELLGNGKELVQRTFFDRLDLGLLLLLPWLKVAAVALCLRSGIPGGLFTPTMTCGALIGGALGHLAAAADPGLAPASCALIGAGGFLASAMGGPVCSIVLLLELTRHIQGLLVPVMLAVAAASITTRSLERRTIYTARYHPADPKSAQRMFSAEKLQG